MSRNGYIEILIHHGANVNAVNYGYSGLMHASMCGRIEIRIHHGANVNALKI